MNKIYTPKQIISPEEINPYKIDLNKNIDPDKFNGEEHLKIVGAAYKSSETENSLTDNLDDTIASLGSILTDIAAGDTSAMDRPEFACLNWNAIRCAIKWLNETDSFTDTAKIDLATNAWRLNFKCKPPTPAEFLTEKYIGPMSESLYKPVKESFIEFLDPMKPYRTGVLGMHIGFGKANSLDTKVYTSENTYCLMRDIEPGDKVLTPTGIQEVAGTSEWPEDDMYELEMDNGKTIKCNIHHIHHVSYRKDDKGNKVWEDVDTKFLLDHEDYEFEFPEIILPKNAKYVNPHITDHNIYLEANFEGATIRLSDKKSTLIPMFLAKNFIKLKSIKKLEIKEKSKCISLRNEDGLYVIDNGVVTHNSLWAVLVNLFLSTHFAMMWHPYKFFGQSVSTVYTQVLGAWTLKKASELLLEPFMNILENAPYFQKIRTHGEIIEKQNDEDIADHIFWTSASKTAALQMQNGVNYKIVNNPGSILGQTILSGTISELTMFEENGWTQEQVLTFFTKLRKRIDSRMKGNYYGRFILDSQPNSMESVIDKWIWQDAPKDPKNYILTGSRWKYYPEDFPEAWDENHNIKKDFINGFPLYKGGNGSPAQVIESPSQLTQFDLHDIIWCPVKQITNNGTVNFWDAARENPIEFLRDWCGIPSSSADRIFYDPKVVEDVFDNTLKNIYGGLDIPATEEPEHLIWDKIKGTMFNKIIDKYYFYYEPNLPRVASIDLAISGDVASISVSHVERSKDLVDSQGNPAKIYVTDFSIPVVPKNSIINLDAFKFFLLDLRRLGNMNIRYVSFDGFQSRSIMQSLERNGFKVQLLSVDKQNEPYQALIDYAFHRRWKCGKSIMAKNNLLSLEIATRKTGTKKIDHKHGENCYADEFCPLNGVYSDQSWEMSQVGYYAKDLTDGIAANIALLDEHDNEFLPIKVWDPIAVKERDYEALKKELQLTSQSLGFTL